MHPTFVVLQQATWHGAWLYGVHRTCVKTAAVTRGTIHITTKQRYKSRHFILSHIRRVHSSLALAVTCHLHIWQNDQDLLRATAVARARNLWSQHRKLTPEKKFLPLLLPGLEPLAYCLLSQLCWLLFVSLTNLCEWNCPLCDEQSATELIWTEMKTVFPLGAYLYA